MHNIIKNPINWSIALDKLSNGAYVLLSVLYHKDIYVTDELLMHFTGTGMSTFRKHKKELTTNGYLETKQSGRAKYNYIVQDVK